MKKMTHLIGGILAGGAVAVFIQNAATADAIVPVIAGAAVGSLLPDIDHPKSTVSQSAPLIRLLYKILTIGNKDAKHRGIMHSLLLCVPWIIAAVFVQEPILQKAFIGISIGYASHLLLDCLNPTGCPLLYPWKRKIVLGGLIKTGGAGEVIILLVLLAAGGAAVYAKYLSG